MTKLTPMLKKASGSLMTPSERPARSCAALLRHPSLERGLRGDRAHLRVLRLGGEDLLQLLHRPARAASPGSRRSRSAGGCGGRGRAGARAALRTPRGPPRSGPPCTPPRPAREPRVSRGPRRARPPSRASPRAAPAGSTRWAGSRSPSGSHSRAARSRCARCRRRCRRWPSVPSCPSSTVVPPPRSGSSSFTVTPGRATPDSSVTFPSMRPIPFQSWAITGAAPARAPAATIRVRRRATKFMDGLSLEPV